MEQTALEYEKFHPQIVFVHAGKTGLPRGTRMQERTCLFYELELITDGTDGGVYTMDQFLPAGRGTLYIRQPGMVVQGAGDYTYYAIVFDSFRDPACQTLYDRGTCCLTACEADLRLLQERDHFFSFLQRLPPTVEVKKVERYLPYFENAFRCALEQKPERPLLLRRELLQILTTLLQELERGPEPENSAAMRSLTQVRDYIDQHFSQHLTLEELAGRACLSREYFCRRFQRYFGTTPMEYLNSVRLYQARYLLAFTDQPIAGIVAACGFSSEQYFYRLFRRTADLSPTQFRRQNRRPDL